MPKTTKLYDLQDAVLLAINTCKDVTYRGKFASYVDPASWVEQLENHLKEALEASR